MAFIGCSECEGDGSTWHYVMNESQRTIFFFARRCICDGGMEGPVLVKDGEVLIDQKTFEMLEAEGYRRITKGR